MDNNKLPSSVVNNYAFADFSFNIVMSIAVTYYAFFLTDVAMISAATMGTILLLARIGDAISVPITGAIIAKFQPKWGQFRSWLLIAPPITGAFFILMFSNFNMSPGTKAIFLGVCYVTAHAFVNLAYNGHMALIGVIGKTPEERMTLSSRKAQFLAASAIAFGLIYIPVRDALGGGDIAKGFVLSVSIFAILSCLGYWNAFRVTKNYDKFDPNRNLQGGSSLSGSDMSAVIFKNPQLLLIMTSDALRFLGFMGVMGLLSYYYTYVVGDISKIGLYLTVTGVTTLIGSLLAPKVAQVFGKKATYIVSSAFLAVGFLLIKFFAGTNPMLFIVFASVGTLGFQFAMAIGPAMYMDAAEYGYNKLGIDGAGFIMSMYAMPIKIGVALSGAAIGYGLAAIKYTPTIEVTPEFVSSMTTLITMIPAVCCILSIVLMFAYNLTDEKVKTCMEENAKKRAAKQA